MGTRNIQFFLISVLFLCLSLKPHLSTGADTISVGQSLSGKQTIISEDGNFELGFFTPGNSQNYYIGIWYKKVSAPTYVWVANRDKPLSDSSSSELKLLEDGNLVLLNESKILIWSTNSTSDTSNSTVAMLLDTGNLALRNTLNLSVSIWESFDHPSDTWLPDGKIGLNKLTNKTQLLTSWRNSEDPAPGMFTLELDPGGTSQYLIHWNQSKQYWTSGTWNGQIFSLVPEMRSNYIYNFSYVTNEKENYFTYSVYNKSIISRFVMDLSGQIKQYTWLESSKSWNLFWAQPRKQCEVYALCGPFGSCNEAVLPFCGCLEGFDPQFPKDWNLSDWSGGCMRKTPLQCELGTTVIRDEDRFLHISNIKLPANPQSLAVLNAEDCKASCLNKCSCTGYAYGSDGCSIWHGGLLGLQQSSDDDSDIYLRLAASDLSGGSGSKKKGTVTWVIVGAIAGVITLLGFVIVLSWCWWKRGSVGTSQAVEGSLVSFGYRDLQSATKNFSEKLGGGGFGSVFKGTLPDSTVIAVKKLEGISQGEKQFRSEVSTIGTIQHLNLVRLHGFCTESTKRLLVYEYMPNGSLDSHLFHQKESKVLDWKTRYQIALGTARGLVYLHEKCRDCIIHCDIKPENILLDAELCPKVADFGLAKLVGREFSRVLTTMRGTRGYLAPEWISGIAVTAKADVYSYGMMLFEVISGRRNSEQSEDGKVRFFPTWAANKLIEGEEILSLLDPKLEGNSNVEELNRACRVACWCIQDDEAHRPSMGQVVQILEGVLEVNLPPIPRSLKVLAENHEDIIFFTESSSNQSTQGGSTSVTSSQTKSSALSLTMSSKS
ncbi:hypothetical protein HHK36_002018 [Tetracentron sinense]|uniref:Receptor-like serine/threonine-protein kinase n=1 Tax=Tetracentron sinense TaxID=13715 RepID=A0A835DVB3_TETSI|nr:hypothetical protein HHK36_002018 [Tetracentron sinense]